MATKKKKPAEREMLTAGVVEEGGFGPPKRNATDLQCKIFGSETGFFRIFTGFTPIKQIM